MAVQGAPFTFEKEARQKGRTWSVFGELQVKLAEDLQLDLANRYTDERNSATWIENSVAPYAPAEAAYGPRSEEHTSELQSLMRTSYAVFCLKNTNTALTHKY